MVGRLYNHVGHDRKPCTLFTTTLGHIRLLWAWSKVTREVHDHFGRGRRPSEEVTTTLVVVEDCYDHSISSRKPENIVIPSLAVVGRLYDHVVAVTTMLGRDRRSPRSLRPLCAWSDVFRLIYDHVGRGL